MLVVVVVVVYLRVYVIALYKSTFTYLLSIGGTKLSPKMGRKTKMNLPVFFVFLYIFFVTAFLRQPCRRWKTTALMEEDGMVAGERTAGGCVGVMRRSAGLLKHVENFTLRSTATSRSTNAMSHSPISERGFALLVSMQADATPICRTCQLTYLLEKVFWRKTKSRKCVFCPTIYLSFIDNV